MMKRLLVLALALISLLALALPISVAADQSLSMEDVIPPEVDYGGKEAKLLVWQDAKHHLFPEEMVDGESIQNDLFLRNKSIEQNLGIQFNITFKNSHGASGDELYNEALAGVTAYEAICCYSLYAPQMALEGILYDLNSMKYPNTEMPWYPADISNWEVQDRLFFVANNSSIRNILSRWVIYANTTMIANKGLEDIEDVVLDGEWTLGKLKEYSRNWASEAEWWNLERPEADRVYGFAIPNRTAIQAFYYGAGFRATRTNADGEVEFAFYEKSDVQQISDFIDVFLDICISPEFGYGDNNAFSGYWVEPLKNKNAAFWAGGLDYYTYLDQDGTYAIIPMPKLNWWEERYYSPQSYAYDTWSVPYYATEPGLGGIIIEATSYDDYSNIAYKFFDLDFKYRYSSDERGVRIFEMIRESSTCDFARAWNCTHFSALTPYSALQNCISTGVNELQLQNTFEKDVEADKLAAKNVLKILQEIIAEMGSMDASHTQDWDHIWKIGTILVPPTHASYGQAKYICACGATKTDSIPKLETGHEWDDGVITTAPTHLSTGVKIYTCSCGETITEILPRLEAHEWDDGEFIIVPTHTTYGWKIYTCTCGATMEDLVPNLMAHEWDAGEITTAPTHTEFGVKTYTCRCGETKTELLPTLPTHTWDDGTVLVAPSHTSDGVTVYTCACGQSQFEVVAKSEHVWGDGIALVPATHTSEGVTVYTCTCGQNRFEVVPKTPDHAWDGGVVTREPSYTAEGMKVYSCVCGETKTEYLNRIPTATYKGTVNAKGTYTITSVGEILNGTVYIPAYIDGVPVTHIAKDAFRDCTDLIAVVIPEGITYVDHAAFYGCTNLKSVTLPSTLTKLGTYMFANCTSLTEVVIPEGVTTIGGSAFRGCTALTVITLPDTVTAINSGAFRGCRGLTEIELPDSVKSVGHAAFYGCAYLTDVTIGSGVKALPNYAFYNCRNLKNVTFENGVTKIGDNAFRECVSIKSVVLSDSITTIGNSAFYGCKNLTSVTLSENLDVIGRMAFFKCAKLNHLVIPASVSKIEYNAFSGCSALKTVYYRGSEAEWKLITIETNVILDKATRYYDYQE